MTDTTKQQRVEHANQLIKIIAAHGRRLFYSERTQQTGLIFLNENGRVFFLDECTGAAIYTHKTTWTNKWRGFSHGGTLRALVEAMRDYIVKGDRLHPYYLGPERRNITDGNIWGYEPEEMDAVRLQAAALPIMLPLKEAV